MACLRRGVQPHRDLAAAPPDLHRAQRPQLAHGAAGDHGGHVGQAGQLPDVQRALGVAAEGLHHGAAAAFPQERQEGIVVEHRSARGPYCIKVGTTA